MLHSIKKYAATVERLKKYSYKNLDQIQG